MKFYVYELIILVVMITSGKFTLKNYDVIFKQSRGYNKSEDYSFYFFVPFLVCFIYFFGKLCIYLLSINFFDFLFTEI